MWGRGSSVSITGPGLTRQGSWRLQRARGAGNKAIALKSRNVRWSVIRAAGSRSEAWQPDVAGIVNAPIFIRLGNRARGPNAVPGVINRVTISNVVASNVDPRHGMLISGIPGHPIENLRLSNIRMAYQGGGTKADAALNRRKKRTSILSRTCSAICRRTASSRAT